MASMNHPVEHAESAVPFILKSERAAWASARHVDVVLAAQIRRMIDNTDPQRPWDRIGHQMVADIGKPLKVRRTRSDRIESLGHWLVPRLSAVIGVVVLIAIAKGY